MELEGQGRDIIMEVTRPLLLGPFYLVKWPVNPNIFAASVVVPHLYNEIEMAEDCGMGIRYL